MTPTLSVYTVTVQVPPLITEGMHHAARNVKLIQRNVVAWDPAEAVDLAARKVRCQHGVRAIPTDVETRLHDIDVVTEQGADRYCENCGATTETFDAEGVPLCNECAAQLADGDDGERAGGDGGEA